MVVVYRIFSAILSLPNSVIWLLENANIDLLGRKAQLGLSQLLRNDKRLSILPFREVNSALKI